MPIDNTLNARLTEIETRAKELLEVVTAEHIRETLELAIRDVAEARVWAETSEKMPYVVADAAEGRMRYVMWEHACGRT